MTRGLSPSHCLMLTECHARNSSHGKSKYFRFRNVITTKSNWPEWCGYRVLSQLLFELLMLGGLLLGNDATTAPCTFLSASADYWCFGSDK